MNSILSKIKHVWDVSTGLLTRLIFLLHGTVSVYFLYKNNNLNLIHWLLVIPPACLILETVITLYFRDGKECKYFWPSGFLYIATIVPIIWIIELDLVEKRYSNSTTAVNGTTIAVLSFMDDIVLSNKLLCNKLCEIGIIIGILVGRWLLPNASISRNELSAMLLAYVGNGGDIMDFLSSIDTTAIIFPRYIKIVVLCVYTWALCQFTLVTSAKIEINFDEGEPPEEDIELNAGMNSVSQRTNGNSISNNKITKTNFVDVACPRASMSKQTKYQKADCDEVDALISTQPRQQKRGQSWFKLHEEFFPILVILLMHDGPFLILRLLLTIKFNLIDELYIFFMCKNGLVCVLQSYRLILLTCCSAENEYIALHDEEGSPTAETSLSRNDMYGGETSSFDNHTPMLQDEIDEIHNDGDRPAAEKTLPSYNSFGSTIPVNS